MNKMKKLITLSLVMFFGAITLIAQEKAARTKRVITNMDPVEVIDSTNLPIPVETPIFIEPSQETEDTSMIPVPILIDVDGNTYTTTMLGTQIWMAQNLKTTRYNDSTPIDLVTDNAEWTALKDPAYCWYCNNQNSKEFYGALYNWYAVNTGKLCPAGWHVPTDAEWTELEIYLQNNGFNYDGTVDADLDRETKNKTAKSLASASHWAESTNKGSIGNTDYPASRNKSSFAAFPGGFRKMTDGSFDGVTFNGFWWSAGEIDATKAWHRSFNENDSGVIRADSGKAGGYSVRCVRD